MTKKTLFSEFLLSIVTIIWGFAFIFQDIGMRYLTPITFSCIRCFVGSLFLIPITLLRYLSNKRKKDSNRKLYSKKELLGGLLAGLATALAMSFQQAGIRLEGAGKSGFISSLYLIFVPIIGFFFKKKTTFMVGIALVFAMTGLYFINKSEGAFEFGVGSIYLLISAIMYAIQILLIGRFSPECDSFSLSAIQFAVAFLVLIPTSFLMENSITIEGLKGAIPSLLFCGIVSTGIAFTMQIYAQKHVNVVIAALIMSLESVFSLIFSIFILDSTYGVYEIIGCILIFIAVLIPQIPIKKKEKAM